MEVPGQECLDRPAVLEVIAGITKGPNCLQLATCQLYKLLNDESESLLRSSASNNLKILSLAFSHILFVYYGKLDFSKKKACYSNRPKAKVFW